MQWLLSTPPPKAAADIWRLTEEEVENGFTEPLQRAEAMNRRFGTCIWRPIYIFIISQADDKQRLTDDGRRGGQNGWSSLEETIYTVGIDMVPAMECILVDKARKHHTGTNTLSTHQPIDSPAQPSTSAAVGKSRAKPTCRHPSSTQQPSCSLAHQSMSMTAIGKSRGIANEHYVDFHPSCQQAAYSPTEQASSITMLSCTRVHKQDGSMQVTRHDQGAL